MVKNRQIKRLIENAIENCNSFKLQGVRSHLVKALKEISETERRDEERKKTAPHQQWKFDIATGTLMNLTRNQRENILGNIERMIEEEKGRNSKPQQEGDVIVG